MRLGKKRGVNIEYVKNEIIGDYGARYLEERELIIYTYPDRIKTIRTALFLCGYCPKEFTTRISQIKNGHTKSCGCFARAAFAETLFDQTHQQVRPTGEKWVHLTAEDNFSVTVTLRKPVYLGRYSTIEQAVQARDKYLRENNPLIVGVGEQVVTENIERIIDPHERQEYNVGDIVGDYNCKYLGEAESKKYRNKQGKLVITRNAFFLCPACEQKFKAPFHSIKKNNAKSCGCTQRKRGVGKGQNQKIGVSGQKHIQVIRGRFAVIFFKEGKKFKAGIFANIEQAIICRDRYLRENS
jgi:hypothetical protein